MLLMRFLEVQDGVNDLKDPSSSILSRIYLQQFLSPKFIQKYLTIDQMQAVYKAKIDW